MEEGRVAIHDFGWLCIVLKILFFAGVFNQVQKIGHQLVS